MHQKHAGLTLIETLVATAFFLVFSVAIYQLYAQVVTVSNNIRTRTAATQLANEQFELIRNLQYYDVGTVGGIPSGVIDPDQTITRNGITFTIETTIRNIDHPEDGTLGGSPNDLSPADNKFVEVTIACESCKDAVSVTYASWIAPKSLETENGNGALVIRAIDANGQPIAGADVLIENDTLAPPVDITDVTDATGVLTLVDAPPATESYQVTVTKDGYSTEQTYTPGAVENPNPSKPHLTVSENAVTQATFTIDETSTFSIDSITDTCTPVGSVAGTFTGTKLIGTTPDVLKQVYSFSTNASGTTTLSNIEWDTYTAAFTSAGYDLIGINPLQPITVPPGTVQDISLIVQPTNPQTILAAVTDAATGLPLAGATVALSGSGVDETKITNIGSVTQTDWSGSGGAQTYNGSDNYATASSVERTATPGQVTLIDVGGGNYTASGDLTSATFDLGAAATFYQLSWLPTSQPPSAGAAPVRFQIATSATNDVDTIWSFLGPDDTDATYYTTPLEDIAAIHDGKRYLRYKLFLSTENASVTPTVTDISFTYTSGCLPPGQTNFSGLSDGLYTVAASKDGYATDEKTITISGTDASLSFSLPPS
ncbi:MAG TPA: hypothetical protein VLB02_00110 [Candidatus Paceibacterota bacterium]|nr:hypothetical protein [Candidatus Paceibacterota bacterium]